MRFDNAYFITGTAYAGKSTIVIVFTTKSESLDIFANGDTHLDYSSKIDSANAIMGFFQEEKQPEKGNEEQNALQLPS